jgi:hypothetical protein
VIALIRAQLLKPFHGEFIAGLQSQDGFVIAGRTLGLARSFVGEPAISQGGHRVEVERDSSMKALDRGLLILQFEMGGADADVNAIKIIPRQMPEGQRLLSALRVSMVKRCRGNVRHIIRKVPITHTHVRFRTQERFRDERVGWAKFPPETSLLPRCGGAGFPRQTMKCNRAWDEEQISKLKTLSIGGASLLRAAAALRRPKLAVQSKARELGFPFIGVREGKRRQQAKCAEAEAKLR